MERNIDPNIFMKSSTVESTTSVEVTPSTKIDSNIFVNNTSNAAENTVEKSNESSSSDAVTETNDTAVNSNINEKCINPTTGLVDVINMSNITHIFNKGKKDEYKLFENFNIVIPDIPNNGQLISIMGASGCGKSRLVRAICGLDDLQEGNINIYGTPLAEYNKNIPMVFQTYSNYEWYTVIENVMLPMKLRGVSEKEAREKAMELLTLVGLANHADKYPNKLSGGQQQRVSIARSLACNSQIIVFDEATGALDIKMKREIQNIILKIFYESKFDPTILNITHSIEEAAYLSNIVYILKPNPCAIHKVINIHYTGEETRQRGEWIFDTPEYAAYVKEITQAMDEVCK